MKEEGSAHCEWHHSLTLRPELYQKDEREPVSEAVSRVPPPLQLLRDLSPCFLR